MKVFCFVLQRALFVIAVFSAAIAVAPARAQYGALLSGSGPVNRSMGGVAVAAPLSASGAMFWNPATLPGLDRSELEASAELLFAHPELASSVPADALGPGVPGGPLSGSTNSDRGAFALPSIGLAYLPQDSSLSYGLGIFAVAGFGLDYAGSTTNPVLTAPPPHGIGVGPLFTDYQVLQITPAVAYQVTERLSVAAGPILDLATLGLDPALFAAPDNANGDGFATYPPGSHAQTTYGGGFIVGLYYKADGWAAGASVKSPQWFDTYHFNSTDQVGNPRQLNFGLDLPLIVSTGASYTGLQRWVFATDVRYIDYADTKGFGDSGFAPDGSLRGLGWRSIVTVSVGAQYQLTDAVSLRAGYSWNQNPIPNSQTAANVGAPTIIENTATVGASWNVTPDFKLSVAYVHGFENSIEGPLFTAAGTVPGASVRSSASVDSIVLGGSLKFGPLRHSGVTPPDGGADAPTDTSGAGGSQ